MNASFPLCAHGLAVKNTVLPVHDTMQGRARFTFLAHHASCFKLRIPMLSRKQKTEFSSQNGVRKRFWVLGFGFWIGFVLSNQLLLSGTSIGANVEKALAGQSKSDLWRK